MQPQHGEDGERLVEKPYGFPEDKSHQSASIAAAEDKMEHKSRITEIQHAATGPVTPPAMAIWLEKEPEDRSDPAPHTLTGSLYHSSGWRTIAASSRGKMHAHEGTYREDAFALGALADWQFVAVADGAGSCRLSRIGSQLACDVAVETIKAVIEDKARELAAEDLAKCALNEAVRQAVRSVSDEAERRQVRSKDLSSTLLLLMHHPLEKCHVVGVLEVGDGIIALEVEGKEGKRLEVYDAEDHGEYSGETVFLPSRSAGQWAERVQVRTYAEPVHLVAIMTDGVADDFFPYQKNLGMLLKAVNDRVIAAEESAQEVALLELLRYEKRGSFDDRTLAILYFQTVKTPDSAISVLESE